MDIADQAQTTHVVLITLGLIHRNPFRAGARVRCGDRNLAQQFIRIIAVLRPRHHTGEPFQVQLHVICFHSLGKNGNQVVGDNDCLVRLHASHRQQEALAGVICKQCAGGHSGVHPVSRGDDYLRIECLPLRLEQIFRAGKVERDQCTRATRGNRFGQPFPDFCQIAQTGQRIVKGIVRYLPLSLGNVLAHGVDTLGQPTEFIAALQAHRAGVITLADTLCGFGKHADGTREAARHHIGSQR